MPEAPDDSAIVDEKPSRILKFLGTNVKETKKENTKPLTKIVIRRLPPKLTKDGFFEEFQLPDHDYFHFVRGDLSLSNQAFSRAYVNFSKSEDIFSFKEKYDDYPMQDEQGREYHAVVEWAPVQRVPKKPKKVTKSGGVESDPKYIAFLEALEKEKNNAGNTSEYFMETDSLLAKKTEVTTTPLLEYIKLKRQQKFEMRNENRMRKREAEKERRKKEDELRKNEKGRKLKDRKKNDEHIEDKAENKTSTEVSKDDPKIEKKSEVPKSSKIEKNVRREDKYEKRDKSSKKTDTADAAPEAEISNVKSRKEGVEEKKHPKSTSANKKTLVITSKHFEKSDSQIRSPIEHEEKKREGTKGEAKSKFRYSEQRKDRELRNQKATETMDVKPIEKERKIDGDAGGPRIRRQSTQETSDASIDGDDHKFSESKNRKDPRAERRIRNKDRPAMEIYRPGMGRFSKQRIEKKSDEDKKEESCSSNGKIRVSTRGRARTAGRKLESKDSESSPEKSMGTESTTNEGVGQETMDHSTDLMDIDKNSSNEAGNHKDSINNSIEPNPTEST